MTIKREKLNDIGKNAAFRFTGIVAQQGIFLISALIITKVLGDGALGDYILAITVLNILGYVSTLGTKFGALRYVAYFSGQKDNQRIKGTIFSTSIVSFFSGVILGLGLFISAAWLAEDVFNSPVLVLPFKILACSLPFFSLSKVIISSLQGLKAIKEKVWLENIIQPLSALIIAGIVLVLGFHLTSVLSGWAFSLVLICVVAIYFLRKYRHIFQDGRIPVYEIKRIMSFSLPLLLHGFLYNLFTRMSILMLGHFKTSDEVGIYGIAARLVILVAIPLDAVNAIFEPTVAQISGEGEEKDLPALYKRITPWMMLSGFPILMFILILAPPFLALFGKNFLGGELALLILGLGQLVNIAAGSAGALLSMTGHPRLVLLNTFSMTILNFFLNLILIPSYGMYGAAAATSISFALINVMRIIEIKLILNIHPFTNRYLRAFLGVLVTFGIIYIVRFYLPSTWSSISLAGVLAILFVVIYALAWKVLRIEIPTLKKIKEIMASNR